MNKVIFFLFALLIFKNSFSQSIDYSISFNTGLVIPGKHLSDKYTSGVIAGFEFLDYAKPLSLFAEGNLNIFKTKIDNNGNTTTEGLLELAVGPRYFINLKSFHPFLDFGMGFYNNANSYLIFYSSHVGLSMGAGTVINWKDKFDFLFKIKFHPYYYGHTVNESPFSTYLGIYGGIKYNF